MIDMEQKKIFSDNLRRYIEMSGKDQKEIAYDLDINPPTFNQWVTGKSMPKVSVIKVLAEYLGTTLTGLVDPPDEPVGSESITGRKYYFSNATAEMAQELFENPDTRMLFDAAKDARPEDLRMAAEMLRRFKQTNTD